MGAFHPLSISRSKKSYTILLVSVVIVVAALYLLYPPKPPPQSPPNLTDSAIIQTAVKYGNPSLCRSMSSEKNTLLCRKTVEAMNAAVLSFNASLCADLPEPVKNLCVNLTAPKVKADDGLQLQTLCGIYYMDTRGAENCSILMDLLSRAYSARNSVVCSRLMSPDARGFCSAVSSGEVSGCSALRNRGLRTECIYYITYQSQDPLLCGKIGDESYTVKCILALAYDRKSCDSFSSDRFKSVCLFSAAEKLGDKSICDEITDEEIRKACREVPA